MAKSKYLFPHKMKKVGWMLFFPSVIFGVILMFFDELEFKISVFSLVDAAIFEDSKFFTMTENNVLDELVSVALILSLFLITFSKEKIEDELVAKIRLDSLLWATYFNYIVLILAILFIYGLAFYWVMILNMFTILLVFLFRFKWVLFKTKKEVRYAE